MSDQVLKGRAKLVQTAAHRLSAEFGASGAAKIPVNLPTVLTRICDAFGVDRRHCVRNYPPIIEERLLTCSHTRELEPGRRTPQGRRPP